VCFRKYYKDNEIKEDEVGSACSMYSKMRNAYKILTGRPEGKSLLERPGHDERMHYVDLKGNKLRSLESY
jgi:hypothetical protein